MKYSKILSAVCACAMLSGCGNSAVITKDTTAPVTTTATTGTTISAMTTPTTSTTTNTTAATVNTETTAKEYTIPSLPDITITTSTALTTTAESTASQTASASKTEASTTQTAVTIGKAFTVEAESITAAAGAKKVPFKVNIHNNPGIMSASVIISYGSLLPKGNEKTKDADYDSDIITGAVKTCMYNPKTQLLAFALLGQKDSADNGTLCTLYFDLPADAKSGAEYPVNITVNTCENTAGKKLKPETISGKITVK